MKRLKITIVSIIIMLTIIIQYFDVFRIFENQIQDNYLQSEKEIDTRVVIIGIDEYSLEELGRWPFQRSMQASVIDYIASGNPAAIGIDILYTESSDKDEDKYLQEVLEKHKQIVLPGFAVFGENTINGKYDIQQMLLPQENFRDNSIVGHINAVQDVRDGVVRKYINNYTFENNEYKGFSRLLYEIYAKKQGIKPTEPKLDKFNRGWIDYTSGPESYEMLPFAAVLYGDIEPDYFEDKIVLIGPYSTAMADDYYYTPLDRQTPMYGVEIHANIIQMYLDGRVKMEINFVMCILITIILMVIMGILFVLGNNKKSLIGAVFFAIVWLVSVKILYNQGIIISIFYPIAGVVIEVLVVTGINYISDVIEKRRITNLFGRYVSPDVVSEIINAGDNEIALAGIKRDVTVLFVDIRGFTPMSELLQPEEVVGILNEYLNLTATSIFTYGGTVDKFIGDATMALFNAPLDLEDHAYKAVLAALAMKKGSVELEEKLMKKFGRAVHFGIGVNSGEAVIGNIGASFRMDYTAIGDTVNTSARLESNAKPGQIIISDSTYQRVKERVIVNDLGLLKVKGKATEIKVYEVIGVKDDEKN